jgi:hypothetical protein
MLGEGAHGFNEVEIAEQSLFFSYFPFLPEISEQMTEPTEWRCTLLAMAIVPE